MGRILVEVGRQQFEAELAASTLLGRHPASTVLVKHRQVPLYWLELRWSGECWVWRRLSSGDGRTRGTGRLISQGWRELTLAADSGRRRRIRCGDRVSIDLIDASPPRVFVTDLESNGQLVDEELASVVEVWADRVLKMGWDEEGGSPLEDCQAFVGSGRPLRVHLPHMWHTTDRDSFNVCDPDSVLDIDINQLVATFTLARKDCRVEGECVRVLAAYALARLERPGEGDGWLSRSEAHGRWLELGGSEQSPTERIGWEKGKLRSRLSRAGGGGLEDLFENRYREGIAESRLALLPGQVVLEGAD